MSKIMGNGGFTVALLNLKVFQRGGRKQLKHVYSWQTTIYPKTTNV